MKITKVFHKKKIKIHCVFVPSFQNELQNFHSELDYSSITCINIEIKVEESPVSQGD